MQLPLRPPALKPDDIIAIMATSSRVEAENLAQGAELLTKAGYTVVVHPQTYARDGQAAGTVAQRLAAFHALFENKGVKAILAASGGNQAGELLAGIDYNLVGKNPKIFMGFSDVTVLLNAINQQTGLTTFHGPGLSRMRKLPESDIAQALSLLQGASIDLPMDGATTLRLGTATGPLRGGNLSLLVSLLGTPWQPDFTGALLFLEDIGDELSRIDRMLQHLANAGALRAVAGIILGGFDALTDTGHLSYERTVPDMIAAKLKGFDLPVVMNAPFGHGARLCTLPVGAMATLTAHAGGATLTLDDPAVAR